MFNSTFNCTFDKFRPVDFGQDGCQEIHVDIASSDCKCMCSTTYITRTERSEISVESSEDANHSPATLTSSYTPGPSPTKQTEFHKKCDGCKH
eukprot:3469016-Amphidinium_carterae.1